MWWSVVLDQVEYIIITPPNEGGVTGLILSVLGELY